MSNETSEWIASPSSKALDTALVRQAPAAYRVAQSMPWTKCRP